MSLDHYAEGRTPDRPDPGRLDETDRKPARKHKSERQGRRAEMAKATSTPARWRTK